MFPTEVETTRRRLDEARGLLVDGRNGASPDWLRAMEDYLERCLEDYIRAVERANSEAVESGPARRWPTGADTPRDGHSHRRCN